MSSCARDECLYALEERAELRDVELCVYMYDDQDVKESLRRGMTVCVCMWNERERELTQRYSMTKHTHVYFSIPNVHHMSIVSTFM